MTGANVARAMQLSAPTVHEMIGRLERDGYITAAADKAIAFTDNGREHAEGIVRRHRLIERFLTDILEIPWDEVHEEAERLEHGCRRRSRRSMIAAIGDAKTCPHGHPIQPGERISGVPLADVEQGAKVTILRFENEAEELLHLFKAEGFEPGREGVIAESDARDRLRRLRRGTTATLTRSVAETVSVTPTRRRPRAPRCPSSSCSPRTATAASVRAAPLRPAPGASRQVLAGRDRPQAVERVAHLREARVERGDAEADRVGAAEVGRHAGLDQRAVNGPGALGGRRETCEPRRPGRAGSRARSRAARATRRGAPRSARSARPTSRGSRPRPGLGGQLRALLDRGELEDRRRAGEEAPDARHGVVVALHRELLATGRTSPGPASAAPPAAPRRRTGSRAPPARR